LAFGPARLSIGLTDLEERTARLGAGLALVGAASERHVKLTGMPCERNYPEAHLLRRLGPRMPIEPETLRDLVPVPFGGRDWLGPRRYAEDYAEIGHAPQSVSFCHVAVDRISLLKWLSGVSMRVPGLSEMDVTSLIRAERAKNPRAGVGQMEQLIKANDPLFPREMVRQLARKLGVKGRRGRKRKNSAE
jgi:hypothetical protein